MHNSTTKILCLLGFLLLTHVPPAQAESKTEAPILEFQGPLTPPPGLREESGLEDITPPSTNDKPSDKGRRVPTCAERACPDAPAKKPLNVVSEVCAKEPEEDGAQGSISEEQPIEVEILEIIQGGNQTEAHSSVDIHLCGISTSELLCYIDKVDRADFQWTEYNAGLLAEGLENLANCIRSTLSEEGKP